MPWVRGVTYRWDDTQTNATLVPEDGLDEALAISDDGVIRTQVWHYPSRAECLACHTPEGGLALGFNTPQLNRQFHYPGGTTNQLQALAAAGYLTREPPAPQTLPALARSDSTNHSVSFRVRSYLAANCAQCHQPSGGALGFWDARFDVPGDLSKVVGVQLRDDRGQPGNAVVTPGSLERSELLRRISFRGPGQMPPIASTEVDHQAVTLLSTWITNTLAGYVAPPKSYTEWSREFFGDDVVASNPLGDPDGDGLRNYSEYLFDRNPVDALSDWGLAPSFTDGKLGVTFPRVPNRGGEIRLERATSLEGPWQPVDLGGQSPFTPPDAPVSIQLGEANADTEYLRAVILDP
jgi:mono/diheme cytochrome c family protein